jgi:hypothetical protein
MEAATTVAITIAPGRSSHFPAEKKPIKMAAKPKSLINGRGRNGWDKRRLRRLACGQT